MNKFIKRLFFLLLVSVVVVSCYPGFDATVDELDLAITKVDEEQSFANHSTFFLYDTVVYVGDDEDEEIIPQDDIDRTHDAHIISEVRRNLTEKGWVEIKDTVNGELNSDVAIMISALTTDVQNYYYYWWDYWYWYPWDWWYWYPVYPGYPMYPYYPVIPTYEYTVGTVFMNMMDMKNPVTPDRGDEPSIKLPVLWTGAINGILTGGDEVSEQRITTQIDQVFEQSPKLQK